MQESSVGSGRALTSRERLRPPHRSTTQPPHSRRKRVPYPRTSKGHPRVTSAERLSPLVLLLLLSCIPSGGLTVSSQHVLHFVCTIRLCVFLVDGVVPGKVSIRALRLEADRFGGPLRRGLPVRWGRCKSCTYRAERSTLDLL